MEGCLQKGTLLVTARRNAGLQGPAPGRRGQRYGGFKGKGSTVGREREAEGKALCSLLGFPARGKYSYQGFI